VSRIITNKVQDNYIIYLGGSITQSTNFKYLKTKKYKVLLIDQNPNCYCKRYCDFFLNISHTNIKKILLNLKNFFYNKKFQVIDCFGVAHYSYPAVNEIKLKYVKNSIDDKFLMNKYVQKEKTRKNTLTPISILLPDKKKLINKTKYYWQKIYQFYKKNDYKIYAKSNGTHQGQGIIELHAKTSKAAFLKEYRKPILDLYKNTKNVYLEKKVEGKLLNLDFIKKSDGQVIFLPLIYRDKVIFDDKKKYLSVFQYLDNSNIIKRKHYEEIRTIIKKNFKDISIFGTIDMIVNDNHAQILEWSPHFHNSKIYDFLNNTKVLDIYMGERKNDSQIKMLQKTVRGGYIFVHDENKETKKLFNFVKKNSTKILIDYIDTGRRKNFLKKHAFIIKKFHILYFKTNSMKNLLKISNYIEINKKLLY
jgi:hypothetical protein|tara:strand:+ start:4365 stop:5621 length:1257 start_codon:yes stop_codon:yes gene_type:complete